LSTLFNPFPGLRPFEADEDHLFFGREKEIDELLRRLRSTRFVSVVGTSGSGKSSLVRCGLISSLYGGFMTQAGSTWRIAKFRPSEDPIGNLTASLNDPAVLGTTGELAATNRILIEATLRRGTLGLVDAYRQARIPKDENLLVVVDQFEELFRFRHSRHLQNSKDEAVAFVKLLLEAAHYAEFPIYVVLTMRSDFIGDCMEYPGLPEAVNAGQYLIPRMTRDEIRAAVTGPVAVGGGHIAQRLVLRLLNDLGDDQDQLPVLQHALMRSWEYWEKHRTLNEPIDIVHYEAVGTMGKALSLHAEEAFEESRSGRGAEITERMFKALTDTFSDPRGIRRPTSVKQLAEICEASESEIIAIVDTFRRPGRSFLTPSGSSALGSRSVIDISHESLMRHWTRLIQWAEEERSSAEFYVRLAQAAAWHGQGKAGLWRDPELELGLQWQQHNHPTAAWAEHHYDSSFGSVLEFLELSRTERERLATEQERARRAKLRQYQVAAAVLAILLIVAGTLGYVARRENARAEENLKLAQNAVDEMLSSAGRNEARVAEDVPELEEFRRELLEKARAFYSIFTQQKPDSIRLREEMARAHFRLGDIERILGRPDAAQEYQAAIDGFQALSMQDPNNSSYRQALGNSYNWLGEILRSQSGKEADADRAYGSALDLQGQLVAEDSHDTQHQIELARTHYNRGIVRYAAGRLQDSEQDFRAAIDLLKPLAEKQPDSAAAQELGRSYNNLGTLMRSQDRDGDARPFYENAVQIHRELSKRQPANREYRQELATFTNNLALLLMDQQQFDLAVDTNKAALDLMDDLASPARSLAVQLANAHNVRCRILLAKAPLQAEPECDQAFRILENMQQRPLFRAGADLEKVFRDLGCNYVDLAKAAPQSERVRAVTNLSRLLPQIPEPDRTDLGKSYQELGGK
jgi:tetratricopeptide (TPR) repeat protein